MQAKVEHERFVVVDVVVGGVQRLDRRHERDPHSQPPVASSLLIGRQFKWLLGAQDATHPSLLAAGDALA